MVITDLKTILLVEDDAIIAMSETMILKRNGFGVKAVYTAEDAITAVKQGGVDLVLMDIDLGLGRMDGTAAAETILEEYEIPIVFCTSHSERDMVERVKGITRYGYVLKNTGEFVLVESINMAFELFEAHSRMKENEERLRLVSELSSDYAYCHKLNEDGSFEPVWHIGSFDKITGYTPEELYEKGGWSALIHPEDIPGAAGYVETLLSGNRASFTARIVTKDGRFRFIHDSGRPWVDPLTGRVIGTMGSARDITALKQNEQELKAIYENAPILMLLVDRDRRIRKANAFAGEFIGSPAEELLGRRSGEALRCVHHLDDPRGCGFGEACRNCSIRLMIEDSFENGNRFYKAEAVLPVIENEEKKDIFFLVSTALLHQNGEDLCLICFEDLTGGN